MIHLFTHTDLDGLGCAIVARAYLGTDLSVVFCDYDNVNKELNEFMQSDRWHEEDKVIISDISPDDETAEKIEHWLAANNIDLVMLDHHNSAVIRLNGYTWSKAYTEYPDGRKTSGTSLVFDYFNCRNFFAEGIAYAIPEWAKKQAEGFEHNESLEKFVDLVRMYDIWEWKTNPLGGTARKLQMIFTRMDRLEFIEEMSSEYIAKDSDFTSFTAKHQQFIEENEEAENRAYEDAMRTFMDFEDEVSGYHVGMCFSNRATSIVCDRILTEKPEIDYIIAVNTVYKKLEFRSQRLDLDLGASIAPLYGGGGHPQAAGALLTTDILEAVFKCIYNSKKSV